jgi:hypothetical protein
LFRRDRLYSGFLVKLSGFKRYPKVLEQFVAIAGIAITVLQANVVQVPIGKPQPGSPSPARPPSQCQLLSATSGDLRGNGSPATELLPSRLVTVRVVCDRPSVISAFIEPSSVVRSGRAEIALVREGSSGAYQDLPGTPNWGTTATFSASATQGSGGDSLSIAARVLSTDGRVLSAGNYSIKVKISIQPSL